MNRTRARRMGDCVLRAEHPAEAIGKLLDEEKGRLLFEGKVSDVQRETTAGFAKGHLTVLGVDHKSSVTIEFQNEFLVARRRLEDGDDGSPPTVIGCVPDLISLVDADSARPIATEEVRFGFRVCVLLLPASKLLRTPEALKVVGPAAFGIENTSAYESGLYQGEETGEKTGEEVFIADSDS